MLSTERVTGVSDLRQTARAAVSIDDATAPLREVPQQVELQVGQMNGRPVTRGAARREVDHHIAKRKPLQFGTGPPEDGVNAGDQLFKIERLRDVVVRPETKTAQLVGPLAAGAQHDHRGLSALAKHLEQLEPVEAGQRQVEQDEIRAELPGASGTRLPSSTHSTSNPSWTRLIRSSRESAASSSTIRILLAMHAPRLWQGDPHEGPAPTSLVTTSTPSWSDRMRCAIVSPRPLPAALASRPRKKRRVIRGSSSAGMPMPRSEISTSIR